MTVWLLLIPPALCFLLLVAAEEKGEKDLGVLSGVMLIVSLVLAVAFLFLPFSR